MGVRFGGRKKGTPNKVTAELRDAIMQAAELAGQAKAMADGNYSGEGGVVSYLYFLAIQQPAVFAGLLKAILPLQLQGDSDHPLAVRFIREVVDPKEVEHTNANVISISDQRDRTGLDS